jgi:hypothetical protein
MCSGSRAAGGEPFHHDVKAARPGPHVLVKVEAVDRVDDDRHAGQARGELTEQGGFRGMRVDDADGFAAEETEKPPQGKQVTERADPALDLDGMHVDSALHQPVEIGPATAYDVDGVAGLPGRLDLGKHQQSRRQINGGHDGEPAIVVDDAGHSSAIQRPQTPRGRT